MSTIASPRDSSINGRRIPLISTPTSSSRPSLENPRSADAPPSPLPSQPTKRHRAALREYYNLKKATAADDIPDNASEASFMHDYSEVQESEMDSPSFNATTYIKHVLETQTLGELLKTYNGVLTDIRALDAEKKALVYDNYSKLITATETIRRMRLNMDPLNPMARTLDPAIAGIYERAEGIKEELKESMSALDRKRMEMGEEEKEAEKRKQRAREVVGRTLDTPEKMRGLVEDGKKDEARILWASTLALLKRWKERGVGGENVQDCIDDGKAALRGETPSDKSWVNVKAARTQS
ncbi:Vps51/Vps67-domain-containing protein [Calycina marina]|uniref:Vacuolar protein sorting-associated protein 51 homolog n=1 Tax=Calycina marina TaxID=1763456 RepID=A0A9P7Z2L8_9HELO|nr:Vps51/Vps67-domain-containing protein [Calycina marina]